MVQVLSAKARTKLVMIKTSLGPSIRKECSTILDFLIRSFRARGLCLATEQEHHDATCEESSQKEKTRE